MNGEETARIEIIVGKLMEAVAALKEDRRFRDSECARHWAITNSLVQATTVEKGTREGIAVEVAGRRQQHHWIVERILQALPVVYGAVLAIAGYIVARSQP